jgi:hypothetical protein
LFSVLFTTLQNTIGAVDFVQVKMMASTYQRYSNLYQARNTSKQNCTHGQNPASHDPSTTKTRQRVAITQEAGYHLWSMVDTIHPALCSLLYRYLNGRT